MLNKEISISYHKVGIDSRFSTTHIHKNVLEIIQALDDNGNMVIKNKIYPLKKGALYLIDGLYPHSPAPLNKKKYQRNIIIIPREYFLKIFDEMELSTVISELFLMNGGCFCVPNTKYCEIIDSLLYKFKKNISCQGITIK